ncbi:MAG: kynureninase [Saprospiraceae bacterium]|nr:kynureninase [Saprospiraceae bacterium]
MTQFSLAHAKSLDVQDPLQKYRALFSIPKKKNGEEHIYLCGNSLGLMPYRAQEYVNQEMEDWGKYGVEGHFHARHPWMPYHEFLTDKMARVVGALPHEVVVMNSLTANLHLMMVSFYRPTAERFKILIDYSPFPSDRYAVESQAKFHGYDPKVAIIELQPSGDKETVDHDDILAMIDKHGDEIALIMIGGVNYYTGQLYPLADITKAGHSKGCFVGFDLAHAAGNIDLQLHDTGSDFAVWCTYKYLNSSPGSLSGCFVHERHAEDENMPRFSGWWGHDKSTRFLMGDDFKPMRGAEGWQLSNPPILPMAAMRASLEIFEEASMPEIRKKSLKMGDYLLSLLDNIDTDKISIITPREHTRRGCQLSIQVTDADKRLFDKITEAGVIADWREPDVIRIAGAPLYNSYEDCWNFVELLRLELF